TAPAEAASGAAPEASAGAAAPAAEAASAVPVAADPAAPAPEIDLAAILSPEGFDFETAIAALEASELSALGRRTARAALEQARDMPAVRDEALARVRRLLGVE
ncbi:MAG: hypothetical protein ACTS11_01600, partial [Roseicyclus sp.]